MLMRTKLSSIYVVSRESCIFNICRYSQSDVDFICTKIYHIMSSLENREEDVITHFRHICGENHISFQIRRVLLVTMIS